MQALSLSVAHRKRYCVTLVFSLRHDHDDPMSGIALKLK
jgi:hypothetical protein